MILPFSDLFFGNLGIPLCKEQSEDEPMIRLIDKSYIKILSNRVKEIISDNLDGKMTLDDFKERFKDIYDEDIDAGIVITYIHNRIELWRAVFECFPELFSSFLPKIECIILQIRDVVENL